jgi:hypothetical protein
MKPILVLAMIASVAIQGQSERTWTEEARKDALKRAIVWQPPAVPIESADLSRTPDALPEELRCRVHVDDMNGLTPKFECALPDGEVVKVKYTGPEPYGEVAASRLLRTLGFGADRVSFVKRVRCYGCPRFPFPTLKLVTLVGADKVFAKGLDYDTAVDFEGVSVERKFEGEQIETPGGRGWAFHELATVPTASRAHRDALTLMAVFLAHWDNKAPNQRLLCPPGQELSGGGCRAPLAMIQDLGATFGPTRVDLPNWRAAPVWQARPTCTVSMSTLPYSGATFPDQRISEAGRVLLASLLEQLSTRQLEDLFTASGMVDYDGIAAESRAAAEWAKVFREKVRAVREGPPCPQ